MWSSRKRHPDEVETVKMEKKHVTNQVNQPHRRHYPLTNQGATCYLSSVLQVLFMTPEIHDRLETSRTLDRELRAIFKKLPVAPCGTEKITEALGIFNVHQQRDAAECLEMILRSVGRQASQVFQGQMKETTTCSKGHIVVEETVPFLILPLSLQGGHDAAKCSVKASFRQLFHRTAHSGDNMVYCGECRRKTEATSECEMVDCPQVLILLLKRFYFDFNTMSDVKSKSSVDVPFTIQTENESYTLYGIVNHTGSLRGGHYTATVLGHDGDTWYDCDDAHVTQIEKQPFANNGKYSSSTAYLLMYRASQSHTGKFIGEQEKPKDLGQKARGPAKAQWSPLTIAAIVFGCVVLVILILFVVFFLL